MGNNKTVAKQEMRKLLLSVYGELAPFVNFYNNNALEYQIRIEELHKKYLQDKIANAEAYNAELINLRSKYLGDYLTIFNTHFKHMLKQVCVVTEEKGGKPIQFTLLDTYLIKKGKKGGLPKVYIKQDVNKDFEPSNLKICSIFTTSTSNTQLGVGCQWVLDQISPNPNHVQDDLKELWLRKKSVVEIVAIIAVIKTLSQNTLLINEWVFGQCLYKQFISLGDITREEYRVDLSPELHYEKLAVQIGLMLRMCASIFLKSTMQHIDDMFFEKDWDDCSRALKQHGIQYEHVYGAIEDTFHHLVPQNYINYAKTKYRYVGMLGLYDAKQHERLMHDFAHWYKHHPMKAAYILRTMTPDYLKEKYLFQQDNVVSIRTGYAQTENNHHKILTHNKASENLDKLKSMDALAWLSYTSNKHVANGSIGNYQELAKNMLCNWLMHTRLNVEELDPQLIQQVLFSRAVISYLSLHLYGYDKSVATALDMLYELAEYKKENPEISYLDDNGSRIWGLQFDIHYNKERDRYSVMLSTMLSASESSFWDGDDNARLNKLLSFLLKDHLKLG